MGKKSRRIRTKNRVALHSTTTKKNDDDEGQKLTSGTRILHIQGNFQIRRVDFHGKEGTGTIYSYGFVPGKAAICNDNVPAQKARYVAFGVPPEKEQDAVATMLYMTRVNNHQNGLRLNFKRRMEPGSASMHLLLKLIREGTELDEQLTNARIEVEPGGSKFAFYELVPQFDCPENWGSRKSASECREDVVDSIIFAWYDRYAYKRKNFMLFIHGNKSNKSNSNWKGIDLATSLEHVNDWIVVWDDCITYDQASFVRKHSQYFCDIAKVVFRSDKKCGHCGLIGHEKLVRCHCKQAWYCCEEHQHAHWSEHAKNHRTFLKLYNSKPFYKKACAKCGLQDKEKLALCGRCETAWYCSPRCLRAHWPHHKKCCKRKLLELK